MTIIPIIILRLFDYNSNLGNLNLEGRIKNLGITLEISKCKRDLNKNWKKD